MSDYDISRTVPIEVEAPQSNHVVTCIRLKPLLEFEQENFEYSIKNSSSLDIIKPSESINLTDKAAERRSYEFNQIWDTTTTQSEIHDYFWPKVEGNLFSGYNASILCYGQTGSGKTFTLCNDGLLMRLCTSIFNRIAAEPNPSQYSCCVSFVEIYLDGVYDLIPKDIARHRVKGGGGIPTGGNKMNFFEGEKHERLPVSNVEDVLRVFELGAKYRRTASHDLNTSSSRSHSLFYFHVTKYTNGGTKSTVQRELWHSRLTIVDLAGSERVSKTHSSGEVFREAVCINQSLSALLDVIKALASKKIVVFRQNLLTLHLKESLLNSYFALICCCSIARSNIDESLCTLNFGSIAKTVQITRIRNVNRRSERPNSSNVTASQMQQLYEDMKTMTTEEYDNLRNQLALQKAEIEQCVRSLEETQHELLRRDTIVSNLQEQIKALRQALDSAKDQHERENQSYEVRVLELHNQLQEKNTQISQYQQVVMTSNEEKQQYIQQLSELENVMKEKEQALKANIAKLSNELTEKAYETTMKEKMLLELKSQKENELVSLHQQHTVDRDKLTQKLREIALESEKRKQELWVLRSDRDHLETEIGALNDTLQLSQKESRSYNIY